MLNGDIVFWSIYIWLIFFLMFRVGGMKTRELMHLVDLNGLEDIVGLGILTTMVSVHMIFITEISEAEVQCFSVFLYYKHIWIILLYKS